VVTVAVQTSAGTARGRLGHPAVGPYNWKSPWALVVLMASATGGVKEAGRPSPCEYLFSGAVILMIVSG